MSDINSSLFLLWEEIESKVFIYESCRRFIQIKCFEYVNIKCPKDNFSGFNLYHLCFGELELNFISQNISAEVCRNLQASICSWRPGLQLALTFMIFLPSIPLPSFFPQISTSDSKSYTFRQCQGSARGGRTAGFRTLALGRREGPSHLRKPRRPDPVRAAEGDGQVPRSWAQRRVFAWRFGPLAQAGKTFLPGVPEGRFINQPPQSIFLEQMPVVPVAKLGPPWAHNQGVANQTSQEIKCNGSFL